MKFHQATADVCVPDGSVLEQALSRTTHMGIGAHQDDLEIMAFHGIAECYESPEHWFLGVTCTNGAGSARAGKFSEFTDAQMQVVRKEEQNEAAQIGKYGAQLQLDYPSATVKDAQDLRLYEDLVRVLRQARPEIVYTHNPADKHDSHLAVLAAAVRAMKALEPDERPKRVYGCEVWRDLDWLQPEDKVPFDVTSQSALGEKLVGVFRSQIAGGKRYDLATVGRRRANATYFESHSTDAAEQVIFGLDLTPVIQDGGPELVDFIGPFLERFFEDVRARLRARL